MKTDKIAIVGLFIGLALLAWYIYKISKKAISGGLAVVPGAVSVGDKLAESYAQNIQTLTASEIEGYGRNLDVLMSELKTAKSLNISAPSSTMISGAQALLSLTDANFKAVVSAWQNKTKLNANDLFKGATIVDETQTLPELSYRIKNGANWA